MNPFKFGTIVVFKNKTLGFCAIMYSEFMRLPMF